MTSEGSPLGRNAIGKIDRCECCGNRAELHSINGDPRKVCGDCAEAIIHGLKEKKRGPYEVLPEAPTQPSIAGGSLSFTPVTKPAPVEVFETEEALEREAYLSSILAHITPKQVEKIIKDLYRKKVFQADFAKVVRNHRWFSLMDLRRIALEINSNVPKTNDGQEVPESISVLEEPEEVREVIEEYPLQDETNHDSMTFAEDNQMREEGTDEPNT